MNAFENGRPAGRVVALWRYPVKSMAGESLQDVAVSWHGLAGDRRWAFVRNDTPQSGFPWFTLRQRADLNHFQPSFVDPALPDKSRTVVRTPSGNTLDVTDPALAEELDPNGVRAIRQNRGVFDTFPLSLVTIATIEQLGKTVGAPLDPQRFRPNVLVQTEDGAPFAEDEWVGQLLRIGGLRMRVDQRDRRCIVTTIEPMTTERTPEILRTIARERQGCLGVYGTTVAPGRIAVNDQVLIESPA